jgi:hypothetical protein
MRGKWDVRQFAMLGAVLGLLYGLVDALSLPGWASEDVARKAGAVTGEILLGIAGFVVVAVVRNFVVARWGGKPAAKP